MSKEELIDKMVTEVLENFDFDRVHRVMKYIDRKWVDGDGYLFVPNHYQLAKKAERLLRDVAQHYECKAYSCASGGFIAQLNDDGFDSDNLDSDSLVGKQLTLLFILTETTSFAEDIILLEN